MTVRVTAGGLVELAGRCGAEDAEILQRRLLAAPGTPVQWTDCEYLHSAVLQVLLASRAPVQGVPKSAFLNAHLAAVIANQEQG